MNTQSHSLVSATAHFIRRQLPSLVGHGVVVAVSGGADSVGCLCVLHALRREFDLRLTVAHVDYGLRGEDSDGDRRFVVNIASRLELGCHTLIRKPAAAGGNLQQQARAIRYRHFAEVARRFGARFTATGHQQNDQTETLLLNAARGSSLAGLGGLRPRRRIHGVDVVRPMLHATHDQLIEYLQSIGMPWREDASNRRDDYARNRVRRVAIPALCQALGQHAPAKLADSAAFAAEDNAVLVALARKHHLRLFEERPHGVECDLNAFVALPRALQRRVLLRAMRQQGLIDAPRATYLVRILDGLADGRPQRGWALGEGLMIRKRYGRLLLGRPVPSPTDYCLPLPNEGRLELPHGGSLIVERHTGTAGEVRAWWESLPRSRHPCEAFDADALEQPLIVRARRPGDRIGAHRVKKRMIEAGLTHEQRQIHPLIGDARQLLWSPGLRRAREAWIGPHTRNAILITYIAP